jgi:hypothetical protein
MCPALQIPNQTFSLICRFTDKAGDEDGKKLHSSWEGICSKKG